MDTSFKTDVLNLWKGLQPLIPSSSKKTNAVAVEAAKFFDTKGAKNEEKKIAIGSFFKKHNISVWSSKIPRGFQNVIRFFTIKINSVRSEKNKTLAVFVANTEDAKKLIQMCVETANKAEAKAAAVSPVGLPQGLLEGEASSIAGDENAARRVLPEETAAPAKTVKLYSWVDQARSMETVEDRLKVVGRRPEYVSFTNPAYDGKNGKSDGVSTWKVHVSVDLKKRDAAWRAIKKRLEETSLKIHGKIHQSMSEGDVQPAKQIVFMVDRSDEDIESWRSFLSGICSDLEKAGIGPELRQINTDPEQASRKWDGVIKTREGKSAYCNYRTDLYMVIEDDMWDEIIQGYKTRDNGNIAYSSPDEVKMVKKSYYQRLSPEKKVNPTDERDFLRNVELSW